MHCNSLYQYRLREGDKFTVSTDDSRKQCLRHHNVDTVGLSQTLGHILPPEEDTNLSVSELQYWLMSGSAYDLYKQTSEYLSLKHRLITKAGARPFLFLRNPDGVCTPACQQNYCWEKGGTPRELGRGESFSNNAFSWWALLTTGYLNLALQADPSLKLVHIWNEPDLVS